MMTDAAAQTGSQRAGQFKYKYSVMTCARWEEHDISEWVQYHRSVGFDHVYVYSNDDDPDPCLRALTPFMLGERPLVTFRHYPKRDPRRPQQQDIYFHFLKNFGHETEWFSLIDVDEFFVFKEGNNVRRFMEPFERTHDSVYFNWLIYGHAEKRERDRDSVLLSHTLRSSQIDVHTKHITRASKIDWEWVRWKYGQGCRGFWHFWNDYGIDGLRLANVLGDDMGGYTDDFPRSAMSYVCSGNISRAIMEKAYIAHFQFKSEQDFMRRVLRGGSHTVPFWKKTLEDGSYKKRLASGNQVWDTYLAAYWLDQFGAALDIVTEHPVPVPPVPNAALRKPTRQSSVHTRAEQDPAASAVMGHGNDGVRTGTYGFRTLPEDRPWWCVDLLRATHVLEVHIYNRMDLADASDKARYLLIESSTDAGAWTELFRLDGNNPVGGIGTRPLVVKLPDGVAARYVRVSSWKPTTLHLDEIEIYGIPVSSTEGLRNGA